LPSTSVALVVTRAATHGVPNGIAVASGIVIGDLVFVTLALLGMSVVAETMGTFFAVLKYIGGAYLIWLGFSLIRSKASFDALESDSSRSSLIASALAGLTLTLGDFKAILFYASLFPSLFDVAALSTTDVSAIVGVTILGVGGVKVIYAVAARKIVQRFSNISAARHARTVGGGILMGAGGFLIAKG
jgi:threonine/homoserine/homoserine lactone efflux protein